MHEQDGSDPIPVPYSDDGYAEYQLAKCSHDQNSFVQVLTIVSIIAAATVFFQRIRTKEHRKFPDNIFTLSLVSLCGIHLALLISIATQNKVVLVDAQPYRSLCQLQARVFHWSGCAAIWNVFCVVIILHRVIVRKMPVIELLRYSRLYYLTLAGLPTLAVLACSLFGGYGPYPGLHNCWIDPGAGRLLYFHSFTAISFLTVLVLGPPTVFALWKACRSASQPTNAGMFRKLLWRQVLLALYGLAVVTTFLIGGINNILIGSHKKSAYIKRTAYPACIFSAINFASLGLFVSAIYWSTRQQSKYIKDAATKVASFACCGRVRSNQNEAECDDFERIEVASSHQQEPAAKPTLSLRQASAVLSTRSVSPRSPQMRDRIRSAFDSDGRSVVSVPPDPKHRAAHEIANNAYTSTLLEYVREQLLDEADSDGSEFSSMYDDDSAGRSSLASDASMDEYLSRTDSSFPTTPQSHFHEVSPRSVRLKQLEDAEPRKAAVTEL